jgi:endonuclease/exonuclease/phosphatase family metal-dependent hydrolase
MSFTRTGARLRVANLHATNDRPELAGPEVVRAAATAIEWAEGAPLLFGGDLNLRPAEQPRAFEQLRELGLERPTGPRSIDHLLAQGMEIAEPPAPLEPVEVSRPPDLHGPAGLWRREAGRRIRLSDHAPVAAAYELAV